MTYSSKKVTELCPNDIITLIDASRTKRDLAAELSVPGHVLDPTKFRLEKLQEMASAQDIPLTKIVPNVEAGWVGKQKGLLQVLWERE